MREFLLFLLVTTGVGLVSASGWAEMLKPTAKPLERFTERPPVGGRNLIGVLATEADGVSKGKGLKSGTLSFPGYLAGKACVRARTADGRYEAERVFEPTARPGEPHQLEWETEYAIALQDVPFQQIAALTTIGLCNVTNGAEVVPTGLGISGSEQQSLQVLVNTRGASTWAVLRDRPGAAALGRVRCRRVEAGTRVAFDAICAFGHWPGTGTVTLEIEQAGRDGTSLEVVSETRLRLSNPPP